MVVADRRMTLGGKTTHMEASLSHLVVNGVSVKLQNGVPLHDEYARIGRVGINALGIMHSKMLAVLGPSESYAIVGSTNWTTSSKGNRELSVLIALGEVGKMEVLRRLTTIIDGAEPFGTEVRTESC